MKHITKISAPAKAAITTDHPSFLQTIANLLLGGWLTVVKDHTIWDTNL